MFSLWLYIHDLMTCVHKFNFKSSRLFASIKYTKLHLCKNVIHLPRISTHNFLFVLGSGFQINLADNLWTSIPITSFSNNYLIWMKMKWNDLKKKKFFLLYNRYYIISYHIIKYTWSSTSITDYYENIKNTNK